MYNYLKSRKHFIKHKKTQNKLKLKYKTRKHIHKKRRYSRRRKSNKTYPMRGGGYYYNLVQNGLGTNINIAHPTETYITIKESTNLSTIMVKPHKYYTVYISNNVINISNVSKPDERNVSTPPSPIENTHIIQWNIYEPPSKTQEVLTVISALTDIPQLHYYLTQPKPSPFVKMFFPIIFKPIMDVINISNNIDFDRYKNITEVAIRVLNNTTPTTPTTLTTQLKLPDLPQSLDESNKTQMMYSLIETIYNTAIPIGRVKSPINIVKIYNNVIDNIFKVIELLECGTTPNKKTIETLRVITKLPDINPDLLDYLNTITNATSQVDINTNVNKYTPDAIQNTVQYFINDKLSNVTKDTSNNTKEIINKILDRSSVMPHSNSQPSNENQVSNSSNNQSPQPNDIYLEENKITTLLMNLYFEENNENAITFKNDIIKTINKLPDGQIILDISNIIKDFYEILKLNPQPNATPQYIEDILNLIKTKKDTYLQSLFNEEQDKNLEEFSRLLKHL